MTEYRVKIEVNRKGKILYYPEYKWWIFWLRFQDDAFLMMDACFERQDLACAYIETQKEKAAQDALKKIDEAAAYIRNKHLNGVVVSCKK